MNTLTSPLSVLHYYRLIPKRLLTVKASGIDLSLGVLITGVGCHNPERAELGGGELLTEEKDSIDHSGRLKPIHCWTAIFFGRRSVL